MHLMSEEQSTASVTSHSEKGSGVILKSINLMFLPHKIRRTVRAAVLGRIPHACFPEEVTPHESGGNVYRILQALRVRVMQVEDFVKAFTKWSLQISKKYKEQLLPILS